MLAKLWRLCLSSFLLLLLSACSNISIPTFPSLTPSAPAASPSVQAPAPKQIALLLPETGDLGNAGKAIEAGFRDAYQNASQKPIIKVYDESQYRQAVSDGANYVVGPLDKNKVAALEEDNNIKVITIALNNPDASRTISNLYEFALSPTDEASQIADKAFQDGYHSALMITPGGPWGQKIANTLQRQWEKNGGVMVGSITVDNMKTIDTNIRQLLEVQGGTRRQDFDVIFLVTSPSFARQIKPYLKFYHAENVPVYSTSLVYSGLMNVGKDNDLNGVEFCDMPLVIDQEGKWAEVRQLMLTSQAPVLQQYIRLYGLGYDAAMLTQNFEALNQGVSGATGKLYKNAQNDILRKLNFAVFDNGVPKPLT